VQPIGGKSELGVLSMEARHKANAQNKYPIQEFL